MIVGRVQHGRIELESALPGEWEGQSVKIEPCTPRDTTPELAQRLAALHALGPMEYEKGEQEEASQLIAAMNALSRNQMQRLAERPS